jgi:hypothetical protein
MAARQGVPSWGRGVGVDEVDDTPAVVIASVAAAAYMATGGARSTCVGLGLRLAKQGGAA